MADLELSFSIARNDGRFKSGKFLIDGLSIIDTGDNYEVDYDNIELYLDGKLYDGSIEAWRGKLSTEELFDQVLSGYLVDDESYSSFGPGWDIFDEIDDLKEFKDGLLMKFPAYEYGEVRIYELDLATPDNRYYQTDSGEVLVLDNDNSIVTDMEHWYEQAIFEDITSILKGDLECLYMGYNVEEMIKEAGGETAWLEDFG